MQITQTKAEELKREYKVSLTADEVSQKVDERLRELSRNVKIPGFRPGKAPMSILKSRYGDAVMGEVLEKAVNDSSAKAIRENDLRPAGQPKIEVTSFEKDGGLEYTMSVDLLPEIKVMDLSKIKLEKLVAKPTDKEVQEALERIAKSNRKTEAVTEARAAKKGDIAVIDFDGTVDGKPRPGMKGAGHHLELGSKSFVDTFEDQLIGTKVGDKKTVTVTFPEGYASAELAGKVAEFAVEVKELRQPVEAKIDAEFAKGFGFDDVEKLKEAVQGQMQAEYDQVARVRIKRKLLDALDEGHDFPAPEGMVEAEFEEIWRQVHHEHHHEHGENCNHDHGEEQGEYKDIALRRVRLGLILAEIGRQSKIEVSNQELQRAVIGQAQRFPGKEKEVFDYYTKNARALDSLRAPLFEEKVVDYILELAKPAEKTVTIEELQKAEEDELEKRAPATEKKAAKGKKK